MFIAALFRRFHVPIHMHGFLLVFFSGQIVEGQVVRRHLGNFAFFHQIYISGIFQNRRNIRSQHRAVFAFAHDQLAVFAGAIDGVRLVFANNAKRIAAFDHRNHFADGFQHIAVVIVAQQVRHHFGIRFAAELVALIDEHFFQFQIVFNDPVMHNGNFTLFIKMRMGVYVRRLAMGGPARMRNAGGAGHSLFRYPVFQVRQTALCLANLQFTLLSDHGNACAVISAVFQPSQPF